MFAVQSAKLVVAQTQQRRGVPLPEACLLQRLPEQPLLQFGHQRGQINGQSRVRPPVELACDDREEFFRRGAEWVEHDFLDHPAFRPADGALDHVFQLAHVSRPAVAAQRALRRLAKTPARLATASPAAIARSEMPGEQVDVPRPRSRNAGRKSTSKLSRSSRSCLNCPASAIAGRSAFVAPTSRTSTRTGSLAPTRSKLPYSTTRKIFSCTGIGIWPISSRNKRAAVRRLESA